jgi:hypothetical protein
MRIFILILAVFFMQFSQAGANDESQSHWGFGMGFVNAPYGDGISLELLLPHLWTKVNEEQKVVVSGHIAIGWDDIFTHNIVTNTKGNYTSESYGILSANLRFGTTVSGVGQSYVETGLAHFTGTYKFTDIDVVGVSLGLGYSFGIGFIRFRRIFFTHNADELAANPDVFGGGYLSIGSNFSFR